MGKSKKTKTTQGDSRNDSQNDWWDHITINQQGIEAYLAWITTPTHEGLGEYRSPGQQEDERDRE